MATQTITMGGEQVDQIAFVHYGHQIGTTELILTANPGLASYGTHLPTGLTISLPDAPKAVTSTTPVKLYD